MLKKYLKSYALKPELFIVFFASSSGAFGQQEL